LRDAACDSGWLRSTSLTAPFLLFSTFHLSLLAAFALRAAAFFPLALRGTFFSNHSLDRESHAWIRWHNTHSRFSFPFLPWQKCTVLPHPVPLKHVALRLTTTWCAVEPDFWIHQCPSVPFIPFQAFEKRPGEAKTHHQKSRLEQCKSSALYQKHRLHPLLARCKRPTSHVTGYWRARHHNRMSCPPCHVLFTTSAQCRTFPTTGLPFVPFFLLSTRLECQGDQGTYGGSEEAKGLVGGLNTQ
jgi:hypothetical protein